jgi:hypothetical protein
VKRLLSGMTETMDRYGWKTLDDCIGTRRARIVAHSQIRRPEGESYHGGYEAEGYAAADAPARGVKG